MVFGEKRTVRGSGSGGTFVSKHVFLFLLNTKLVRNLKESSWISSGNDL